MCRAASCRALIAVRSACGGCVKLSLLPGWGHNVWEPAMYEHGAIEWLLTHRLSDRGA